MSNRILFIFEGERPEKQITNNLTKYFLKENIVIQCAFCSNIYQLYKEISEDEDLDTFLLLKNMANNVDILSSYNSDDFAEIYMFFDYDGHDTSADDNKVTELLNLFNEETQFGKLFISYPMVEALKHYTDSKDFDFKQLEVKAKENIKYKQIVGEESKNELRQITKYTKDVWILLIGIHLRKMNYIISDSYSLPTEGSSQRDIFDKQLEKYINKNSTIAVLSSFPIFLYDYYGNKFISELFSDDI